MCIGKSSISFPFALYLHTRYIYLTRVLHAPIHAIWYLFIFYIIVYALRYICLSSFSFSPFYTYFIHTIYIYIYIFLLTKQIERRNPMANKIVPIVSYTYSLSLSRFFVYTFISSCVFYDLLANFEKFS